MNLVTTSIRDQVYKLLKEKILRQEYKPGQRLYIDDLVREFRVSPTPLKESLNKLAGEDLIHISRKGTFVAEITRTKLNEICEARIMIEKYAIDLAPKFLDKKQIDLLRKKAQECAKAAKKGDYKTFVEKDYEFHISIVKISKNKLIQKFYRTLNVQLQMAKLFYPKKTRVLKRAQKWHEKIVELLVEGEYQEAKNAIEHHVIELRDSLISKMPAISEVQ